jgi:hypothetical protein
VLGFAGRNRESIAMEPQIYRKSVHNVQFPDAVRKRRTRGTAHSVIGTVQSIVEENPFKSCEFQRR